MNRVRGYMESLAEIRYRSETGKPKSRPTVYRGIEFRSRLEARFAMHLDTIGERWRYEPRIYGPRGRGYLPDFEILGGGRPTFIEVKPTREEAPDARDKMAVIWETHPDALLLIAVEEGASFFRCYQDGTWDVWRERWAA